jgi:hypothetical protein
LQTEKVKALSRTYAQAIAGKPLHMTFNSTDPAARFVLAYAVDVTATANTEIFLNQGLYYPTGYAVTIVPEGAAKAILVRTNMYAC